MVDKDIVAKLAKKLFFEFDSEQIQNVVNDINQLDVDLAKIDINPDSIHTNPTNNPRVINCSCLRVDNPSKKDNKDYLSNAKTANKYVIGK